MVDDSSEPAPQVIPARRRAPHIADPEFHADVLLDTPRVVPARRRAPHTVPARYPTGHPPVKVPPRYAAIAPQPAAKKRTIITPLLEFSDAICEAAMQ